MRLWTVLLATTLAFASVRASDIDGDGHLDAADCDDRDASAWSLPGEPTNLHFVSKTTFLWDAAADIGATAATFVTVRSTSPSNFAAAPASCADPEGLTASTTDASVPPLGTAFYYLVRARNACGDGLLGHRSNGAVTPGLACDCSVICDDAQACTRDRCADGICAHDPLATVIADQPDDVAVCPGGSATFRVRGAPDGAGPHYQWKKNGVAVGTDSPTLTLTGLAPGDDNVQITAVVSGACAPTTSSTAILTVFPSAISCSGGGNGYEAPNGATSIVSLGDPDAPTSGRMRDYGRVQLATGEYVIEDVDLSIEGRGFDFVWKRTYRSRTGSLTPMGYNWDFSYNRRIEVSTTGITLHAGNGRADVYAPSTTGCYVSPGFFRELCPQADGSWVLTFADRTTWRFAALDGSPTQGRIVEAQDTDANTMSFAYDSTGKLQTITDTLGRPVTIAYTAGGYVSSITDFAGRQVVYQSCSAVDPTCMPGDLASVTSPPITGTPNGNDLPEGRKTLYTYAAYTGDPALDHNLNTVGKWFRLDNNAEPQVIVHNVYSGADRLEKQVYGDDPFTSVSYVYATPPAAEEPGAATKTIVRDRVGNVGEVYFDASNRAVAVRRYTGRAPSLTLPTGVTTSRPGAPLRATDPPYFRTTFAWNEDSLLTQATFPKLDTVGFTYDSAVTNNMRIRANALEARRTAGPAGGDQTLLHAQWTYAPDWGTEPQGLCVEVDGGVWPLDPVDFTTVSAKEWFEILVKKDVDLVGLEARWVTYTDPNGRAYTQTVDPTTGHVTSRTAPPVSIGQPAGTVQSITESWAYNTHGQVIGHTDPKGHVTQATYYSSGPATGYLESVTVDAPAGTPGALALLTVTARDAFGNATALTDPNGHTRTFAYNQLDELVRYVTPSPSSYTTDLRYDAAGRLSRIDRDNRDETGAFRYRPKEFTGLSFDALDRPTSLTVDGPGALDPNGGLNLRSEVSYDGNGWATLVRRRNAVAGTQPHETTRILYDERALPYRVVEAEGDAAQSTVQLDYDLDGGVAAVREGLEASPRTTTIVRDGYGRGLLTTDPMGNVTSRHYDANGNVVSERVDGELVDGASGTNVRLSETAATYDEIGRLVQMDTAFFDTETQSDILDGTATWKYFHDERSQIVRIEDDDEHGPMFSYDGAGRLASAHDAVGNTIEYGYDAKGNVLTSTRTDVSSNPTLPPRVTVTTNTYDELDSNLTTSQAGVTHSFVWDSARDLPAAAYDGRGNVLRHEHDDAGRYVATRRTMTDTGTGSGSVTFVLDATRSHDDEGRITSQTDDAGNTTTYGYDAKGRLTSVGHADGRSETYVYDVHDDLVSRTDENGTVVTSTYDALGRLATRSIARAPGVLGTTAETWKHDGLSRVVYAGNDGTLVTRRYDSLSHLTGETSTAGGVGTNVNWLFTGGGQLLSTTYPSGHHTDVLHDAAGRWASMTSLGPGLPPAITSYEYLGPDKVVRRGNGNGTETLISFDALLRPEQIKTQIPGPGGSVLDDRTLLWDADSNKTMSQSISSVGAIRHDFTYDSASRMIHSERLLPGQLTIVAYVIDGANNRESVTGGPDAGVYTMSSTLPEPGDRQMNQYTSTPADGARAYDPAGDLVSRASGGSTLAYDYRNRLILVSGSTGDGSYVYDAFGRRVLVNGTRLIYDGTREIEQRAPGGALERVNVYGACNELLMTVADVDQDGLPDRAYHHTDDLGSDVLVTDQAGNALERYDYGDYGRPRVMSGAGALLSQSAIGNPFLFGGRRYDASTGLYDAGTRHLDPGSGRFVSRDPLGVWGDPASLGNATAYAGNNPWSWTDSSGMAIENRDTLKTYFETGNVPTQDQFYDLIKRRDLDTHFETGDIPTADDFADALVSRNVLKSFFQTGDKPTQARVSRNILKSFFQTGDKPSASQFGAFIDSNLNLLDDRAMLGLKSYDPTLTYLPGDTVIYNHQILQAKVSREVLKTFFQTGDKPSASQFGSLIDSSFNLMDDRGLLGLKSYDPTLTYLPGDCVIYNDQVVRARLPRSILKSFFQTGDKPTQAQFEALIDSMLNRIDDRYLLGLK